MFTLHKPFLLQAITSVHAGSGSEIGHVDLPIQREKHTGYPKIESSSVKGALRSTVASKVNNEANAQADFAAVFGSAPKDSGANESQASAVSFLDARILLFPIRSLKGTFVWITCPDVLHRFNREMKLIAAGSSEWIQLPVAEANTLSSEMPLVGKEKKHVVLEEFTIPANVSSETAELALNLESLLKDEYCIGLKDRLVVLTNDEFTNFVKLSTEVNARIRIDDHGRTDGGLWYEENIPPETVFYSALLIGQVRPSSQKRANGESKLKDAEDVKMYIEQHFPEVFQLGGNHTIGKGILRTIWLDRGNNHAK